MADSFLQHNPDAKLDKFGWKTSLRTRNPSENFLRSCPNFSHQGPSQHVNTAESKTTNIQLTVCFTLNFAFQDIFKDK